MRRILATGTTGTIGKHLFAASPLSVNLLDTFNSIEQSLFTPSSIILHAAGIVGDRNVSKDINNKKNKENDPTYAEITCKT